MTDIEGFILVGGRSRRMGKDKALLRVAGTSFTERIAQALATVAENVSVVGARNEHGGLGLPAVADIFPEWGALGGLHAALSACAAEWAAVVACDLPFVTGPLFSRLASLRAGFDAVVPVQQDERLQPLCALYRRAACLPVTEQLILAGERMPRVLVHQANSRLVRCDEITDLNGWKRFFVNVNTPLDYSQALAEEQGGSP